LLKSPSAASYCLGIESTADDFSVGIASFDGKILANVISAYVPEKGGIHPREAARHHTEVAGKVLAEAFQKAKVKPQDISIVAFSQGPGLGPCLRTGATAARALASYLGVPLVGVNHCVAHIEIGKLVADASDPVALYVSGGNTIVSAFEAERYRVFGETLDIAVGNCLDVFAREAGLHQKKGMPLGAMVEEWASRGQTLEDVCFSLQEVAFSMLTEVTERALAHTEKPEILLTGGVAANKRLQSMLKSVAEEHKVRFCMVPKQYALDNGAMIAWTGILAYQHHVTLPIKKSFVKLKWRLDEVPIPWVGG